MSSKRFSFETAAPMLSNTTYGGGGTVVERRQYGSRDGTPLGGANSSPTSGSPAGAVVAGSGGGSKKQRQRSSLLLFERASGSWWNPRFASNLLENQYLRCAFPQIRFRFRFGLAYLALAAFAWFAYHAAVSAWRYSLVYQLSAAALITLLVLILLFTFNDNLYQRFYGPAGFLCTFVMVSISLLFFCVPNSLISPTGTFAMSLGTILILYTVIPLPLYVLVACGLLYSVLYEILTLQTLIYEYGGVKFALHLCGHVLGAHLFILTQVRNRKTFIKIGQSLLASKDLESEKQFKDNMIESVMPRKVAEELLKETIEFRRPSTASAARGSIFRPFTMNLMIDVSILFADIAGFTKMSSNKSAEELVDLLNDLFGRFDKLCTEKGCEKISTLGDCYYCVSGCPEPRPDHAQCCVEMGLAMCIAIMEFDHDRNQEVNMRVGIHTGTVMCGIVGTKRFKFDVFSNDVNLANTMESSGKAGHVHVSESTARFISNDYVLEEGDVVDNLKTFFVVCRTAGKATPIVENNLAPISIGNSPSSQMGTGQTGGGSSQNLAKNLASPVDDSLNNRPYTSRLKDDLRHIDSSEIEYEIDRIDQQEKAKLTGNLSVPETKKSASLAVLSGGGPHSRSTAKEGKRITFGGRSGAVGLSASSGVIPETMSESQVAQQQSGVLGNGTGGGAGGRDPESSPYMDNVGSAGYNSEAPAAAADTKVDLAAHATSITRFDTAHMDFDQRLVNCVQNSSMSTEGYWSHENAALNKWTLTFKDRQVERDYRAHFASELGQLHKDDFKVDDKWRVTPPKYSVLLDVLVSIVIYLIVVIVAFGVFGVVSIAWILYFALSALVLLTFATFTFATLSRRGVLTPPLTHWAWRHATGLLLIDLPLGAAYANVFCLRHFAGESDVGENFNNNRSVISPGLSVLNSSLNPDNTAHQLVIVYILFVVMIGHCNFSQLVSWTKSLLAVLIGASLVILVQCCLCVTTTAAPSGGFSREAALLSHVYPTGVCDASSFSYDYPSNVNETYYPASFLSRNFNVTLKSVSPRSTSVNDTTAAPPAAPQFDYVYTLGKKFLFHPALFYGVPVYRSELILDVLLLIILITFLNYQFESNYRMSFYGDKTAYRTILEMGGMKEQADWLLCNIIPHHIQDRLLKESKYSENHEMVAVIFASITNWHEMYEENFEGGREFLRVLNELVADFDELLDRSEYVQVEKIKTIGTTYMAASGLNTGRRRLSMHPYSHLYELMDFALSVQEVLDNFNKDLLNFDFKMKIGYNIGPVTAGVIGSTKLYYDIWGDTVNIASRMYSNGVCGRIQVSEKAKNMLEDVYEFEFRDHIEVKGIDGGMEVYLLKNRREHMNPRSRTGTASTPPS